MNMQPFQRWPSASVSAAFAGFALCLTLLLLTQPISAETLSTATVGTFPKEVAEFARTDLSAARKFEWFETLRDALLPRNFELFSQFAASVSLDPNNLVDALYWGVVVLPNGAEQLVGIAIGQFDSSALQDQFERQKLPSLDYQGFRLYAFGSGHGAGDIFFTLPDSNAAAFGQRAALEKLIDVRTGASERLFVNENLYPLISEANSNAMLWAVLDHKHALQVIQRFVPAATRFAQTAAITDRLKALIIEADAKGDSEIDLAFQVVCDSVDDANVLSAALQVGLMSRRYLASDSDPSLAAILDQSRIVPRGDSLELNFALTQEDFKSLVLSGALLR